jgi:hypothetical protein
VYCFVHVLLSFCPFSVGHCIFLSCDIRFHITTLMSSNLSIAATQ